ncbi:MAG: ANTAR domain-containing protein [Lachnospiraceae bacterium]|nr:ANTAR domain-containing protein [Lachnospiraceae bacterium]
MSIHDINCHSILIVSASEQFDAIVKRSLKGFTTINFVKSGSLARRSVMEKEYDIIVVNSPLPDETGIDLALDTAEKSRASILLVVPKEIYEDVLERVTDLGVLVLPKPFPKGRVDKAVRFLAAIQKKSLKLEKKVLSIEEKMEELRLVSRAKILLVEKKNMSEDEAHRYIGKAAMDNGVSRKRIAEKILEDIED